MDNLFSTLFSSVHKMLGKFSHNLWPEFVIYLENVFPMWIFYEQFVVDIHDSNYSINSVPKLYGA